MPELDVPNKPKPKDKGGVVPPPNQGGRVATEPPQDKASPPHRLWLHIGIAALVVGIGGFYAWRKKLK